MDGRSTVVPRPRVELDKLLMCGARRLGLTLGDLQSRQRSPVVVKAREVVAWVAVVLWYEVNEVARGLEKYVETASRLVSRAAARRVEDEGFRALVDAVDAAVIDQYGEE